MSTLSNTTRVCTWRPFCLALCASASLTGTAVAQASEQQVIVLRSDLAATDLSESVDEELSKALSAEERFESAYFSPTPYVDIELAAGCEGSTGECVERVANSLNAEQLLVRELRHDATGALVLGLVARDSASSEARRVESPISRRGETRPELVVPELIARLYGGTTARSDDVPPKARSRRPLRIAGAAAMGTSAALLVSGAGAGVASRNSHARYQDISVEDESSAERAESELDDAQRRARAANTLFVSSAVLAGTGAVFFLWDYLRKDERPSPYAVNVMATPNAGLLSFSGPLERF